MWACEWDSRTFLVLDEDGRQTLSGWIMSKRWKNSDSNYKSLLVIRQYLLPF